MPKLAKCTSRCAACCTSEGRVARAAREGVVVSAQGKLEINRGIIVLKSGEA